MKTKYGEVDKIYEIINDVFDICIDNLGDYERSKKYEDDLNELKKLLTETISNYADYSMWRGRYSNLETYLREAIKKDGTEVDMAAFIHRQEILNTVRDIYDLIR